MTPEQITQERAKYGIPAQGYASAQTSNTSTSNKRVAALDAAWGATPATKSIEPVKKAGVDSIGKDVTDLAIGAGKGAISTLQNIGNVIAQPLNEGLNKVLGQNQKVGIPEEKLQPTNTAQKVGNFVEQAAELVVPISKVGTAAKGVKILSEASKVKPATKLLVNTLPRAAAEGLTAAGVVSAQNGEVDEDTAIAGLISGAIPIVGPAGKAIVEHLGPNFALKLVNSLIKPLKKDFSYGKDPGRGVAEEGIVAKNFDELASKIDERLNIRTKELTTQLLEADKKGIKIDLSDALSPIDKAIAEAQKAPRTNQGIIQRLTELKDDLMGVKVDEKGVSTATRNLTDIPSSAVEFKRLIGNLTKFTGNVSDDAAVNSALKKVYGQIKEKVNKAVPEAEQLNERIADLISAKVATQYRDVINERQNIIKMGDSAVGLGTALVTAISTGGAAIPTLILGAGAVGLKRALGTPLVKTKVASWLAGASAEEKKRLFDAAPWIKATLIEGLFGDTEEVSPDEGQITRTDLQE